MFEHKILCPIKFPLSITTRHVLPRYISSRSTHKIQLTDCLICFLERDGTSWSCLRFASNDSLSNFVELEITSFAELKWVFVKKHEKQYNCFTKIFFPLSIDYSWNVGRLTHKLRTPNSFQIILYSMLINMSN